MVSPLPIFRKGGNVMAESILNGMRILAVDDEPDVLAVLEDEILEAAPKCQFEKAISYQEASKKIESQNFDMVILDIMGVRGFDLLDQAVKRNFQVAMLTAHSLNPESLKRSIEMKARAYLPKEKMGEIVPFLEDIVKESDHLFGWGHLMNELEGYFESRWGEYWQKAEENFWKDFEKKTSRIKR
jgi:CheY-like chemotaxis protein